MSEKRYKVTPGMLFVSSVGLHGTSIASRGSANVHIAWLGEATTVGESGSYSVSARETEANANRIVSLWNACANRSESDIKAAFALWDNREKVVEKLEKIQEWAGGDGTINNLTDEIAALLQAEKEGTV